MGEQKDEAAKHESATRPGKDDVHEQRQADQPSEGAVKGAPIPQHPKGETR